MFVDDALVFWTVENQLEVTGVRSLEWLAGHGHRRGRGRGRWRSEVQCPEKRGEGDERRGEQTSPRQKQHQKF